jgi:hypothetical protein
MNRSGFHLGRNRYFEDYVPGTVHEFGPIAVELEEVVSFGKRFVPLAYHPRHRPFLRRGAESKSPGHHELEDGKLRAHPVWYEDFCRRLMRWNPLRRRSN